MSDPGGLVDFVNAVPPQLTLLLVHLGPYVSTIRHVTEILSWRTDAPYDSWLALAVWWAICLLVDVSFRYLLPVAAVFVLSLSKCTSTPAPVVNESNLHTTITDLSTIQLLLPKAPYRIPVLPVRLLIRVAAYTYVPYLIFTYVVPARIIVACLGSVVITWRAPWALSLRLMLWRIAFVRWSIYHLWSSLSGLPMAPITMSVQSATIPSEPVNSARFLFELYENQRWWMGLDWTAALLPNERPSWCSATQQPVSPPNAFTLPESSTVFMSDGKGGRVKRIASWAWEEEEWKVLIHKEGGSSSRIQKPLPTLKEESPSLLSKAAGKMREASSSNEPEKAPTAAPETETERQDQDIITDVDGWVYADNKWEGLSNKGGIGKYTRFRRWSRVAVVSESVQPVEPGETGVQRTRSESPNNARQSTDLVSPHSSPLRERLKNTLAKS